MRHIKLFENFDMEGFDPATDDLTGTAPCADLISVFCGVPKADAANHVKTNAVFDDMPFEDLESLDREAVEDQIKDDEECEFVLSTQVKDLLIYINGLRMNVEAKGDPDELISKWEGLRAQFSK